jgi:hypothetical protein
MNKIRNTRKGGKQTQKKQKMAINKQKQKQKKLEKSINKQTQKPKKQKKAFLESTARLNDVTVTETMNDGTKCVRFKIVGDEFGNQIKIGRTYWVNNAKRTLRWSTEWNPVWDPPIHKKKKI